MLYMESRGSRMGLRSCGETGLCPNMASNRQQAEQVAAEWIAKRDAGPWDSSDSAALEAWLNESAGNRVAYYRFNSAWQETGRLQALIGEVPMPEPELE